MTETEPFDDFDDLPEEHYFNDNFICEVCDAKIGLGEQHVLECPYA